MSLEIRNNVLSVPEQHKKIRESDTYDNYRNILASHFRGASWNIRFENALRTKEFETSEDYFRLTGLTAILAAEYGFDFLEGQLNRHKRKNWQKLPSDPKHQIAVASYLGDLNSQAIAIKEHYEEDLRVRYAANGIDSDVATGIWGVRLPVSSGSVDPHGYSPKEIYHIAETRMFKSPPILLPDKELNNKFADLEFTGYDAERMTDRDFEKEYLPEVQKITKDLLDPTIIFQAK